MNVFVHGISQTESRPEQRRQRERRKEKSISLFELFERRDTLKKEALLRKILKLKPEVVPGAQGIIL